MSYIHARVLSTPPSLTCTAFPAKVTAAICGLTLGWTSVLFGPKNDGGLLSGSRYAQWGCERRYGACRVGDLFLDITPR